MDFLIGYFKSSALTFSLFPFKLPRVRFGCFTAGAGPDLIQLLQGVLAEFDLQRAQCTHKLIHGARANDRRSHNWIRQEPCPCDIRRLFVPVFTELLPRFELHAFRFDFLFEVLRCAPA